MLQSRLLIAYTRGQGMQEGGWFKKRDLSSQHSVLAKAHDYGGGDLSAGEV